MNINIVSDADDFLNGNIQFIAEVFLDAKQNPVITIRKNADGILGLHLSGWDCKESIEVYNENPNESSYSIKGNYEINGENLKFNISLRIQLSL